MEMTLTYDDILMVPRFSRVKSRKDVDPSVIIAGTKLTIPIISSNMDTVTGHSMATAIQVAGGIGCLHRFSSIADNVTSYLQSPSSTWVSIGLGAAELERAAALHQAGAKTFVIDVAHGASVPVVEQTIALRKLIGNDKYIIVGNFATGNSLKEFLKHLGEVKVDAVKVGIGPGSACTTRIVTGNGCPSIYSIISCASIGIPIIADGGLRNAGDVCKAIAAGASAVMLGKMLAGTDESPGSTVIINGNHHKSYRGSASAASYAVQGKTASHRAPEGESFYVPYVGSVASVMQKIDGGLRSCMSYQDAFDIAELQRNAEFVQITSAGSIESHAHGATSK